MLFFVSSFLPTHPTTSPAQDFDTTDSPELVCELLSDLLQSETTFVGKIPAASLSAQQRPPPPHPSGSECGKPPQKGYVSVSTSFSLGKEQGRDLLLQFNSGSQARCDLDFGCTRARPDQVQSPWCPSLQAPV